MHREKFFLRENATKENSNLKSSLFVKHQYKQTHTILCNRKKLLKSKQIDAKKRLQMFLNGPRKKKEKFTKEKKQEGSVMCLST